MSDMDYFRSIQGARGLSSQKDVRVEEFRTRFGRDFDTSINFVRDAARNGVRQDFIITPTKDGCKIWARPGESFYIGDIIFYNTLHWLVTDVNFHDEMTCSGRMVRCNRQIRWQNDKTGEIVERWCLVTKPYTSNIDNGVQISTSNREFKVQVPYDSETQRIDLGKRFMLDVINGLPRTYECTSVDQQTNKYQDIEGGFIVWNLTQDAAGRHGDNVELMLCDYVPPDGENPPPEGPLLPCSISGRDTIRAGLGDRKYAAVFYGEDGQAVADGVDAVWSVEADPEYEAYLSWSVDGSVLSLAARNEAIGQVAVIVLRDTAGLYAPARLEVEVTDTI